MKSNHSTHWHNANSPRTLPQGLERHRPQRQKRRWVEMSALR
ncbi:hypothetical protein V5G28_016525 [Scytonema sp. PRP1]